MSLIQAIRAKGHQVRLGADHLTVVITLGSGGDAGKAESWAKANEQQLRRELVSEIQTVAGVRGVFPNAKLVKVRGKDGQEIRGKVEVRQ